MKLIPKVSFLIVILLVCITMLFFKEKSLPVSEIHFKKNQPATLKISIDDQHPGIAIPGNFLGLSYEINSLTDTVFFRANHLQLKNLMSNLGNGILRLNGYYINFITWSGHKRTALMAKGHNSYLTDSIASSDLDSLFTFIRPTKWKIILGIQLLNSNPARSASEVKYALTKGNDLIYAFEIGNENDHGFGPNFQDYYSHFIPEVNAIKNVSKNAPLCGPASVHPKEEFFKEFVANCADQVNFVTIHDYSVEENHVKDNIAQLLSNKGIDQAASNFKVADSLVKEKNKTYRISECNNFGNEGVGVADKFASALWGIDYMFTAAQNGATGINFHGGGRGFTPITMQKGKQINPQPLYYAMLFFHLASQGRLLPVEGINSSSQVKAYAVLSPSKKIFVTLINKDSVNDENVQFRIKRNPLRANLIQLSGSSVSNNDVTLGGSIVDKQGNWKPSVVNSITSQNGLVNVKVSKGSALLVTIN